MTLDKRTAVLGVAAAAAVAAAIGVTVFGHGSATSPQRRAVSAYIDRVNAIQNQMGRPLTRVMLAYRTFTSGGASQQAAVPKLAAAAATLTRLDRRLAAEPAPPEAKTLRRRLVALVGEQAAITREVEWMAVFSPRFALVLAHARAANAALGHALRSIAVPKAHALRGTRQQLLRAQRAFQARSRAAAAAQADAIDAYLGSVAGVVRQLERLRPPPVFRPSYEAQLRTFRTIVRTGAALAAELRKPNRVDVSVLGRRFALSSRIAQSTAAQRAQIAAIKRYDARARAVSQTAAGVQAELQRLGRSLP